MEKYIFYQIYVDSETDKTEITIKKIDIERKKKRPLEEECKQIELLQLL